MTPQAPNTSEPLAETAVALENGPLRQGDIFRWEATSPPWKQIGVIITADCDISHRKHAGTLSYVPILCLEEYWRLITLPRKIERYLSDKFTKSLYERIRALQRENRPEFPEPLSDDAIAEMLRLKPELVMQILNVPENGRGVAVSQLSAYQSALDLHDGMNLFDLARRLAALRAAVSPAARCQPESILDDLLTGVDALPGDAFFIGRIAGIAGGAFVAYLRLVRELHIDSIATVPSQLRRQGTLARRVSHLLSPFVYRMTQQLAQVFSDIGLPTQYDAQRADLAKMARDELHSQSAGGSQ